MELAERFRAHPSVRAVKNFAVFLTVLATMALVTVAGNSIWENLRHEEIFLPNETAYRRNIESCLVKSIESEVDHFAEHGYLTFGSYSRLVAVCQELEAAFSNKKEFGDLAIIPTPADLIASHPNIAGKIRAYFHLIIH